MSEEAARERVILIVDDDRVGRESLAEAVTEMGHRALDAPNGIAALSLLEHENVDLVLTDLRMPDMDGLELLDHIKRRDPTIFVILVTAYATVNTAVEAMRKGAFNYIMKPIDLDQVKAQLDAALRARDLLLENISLKQKVDSLSSFNELVGRSAPMKAVLDLITQVADTESVVLIRGESGTGKELVARALHYESGRAGAEFVAVNCAAVPQTLLEAELFGVERGAATGVEQRPGKFELAAGGTLLLDEIGDMPAAMQAKLLRVLQERRVTRIGATTETPVDVRVVSATNRDLRSLMASGAFREDLFWRLCVIEVHVPPLRERPEDIPVLGRHFLASACKRLARRPLTLSSDAERLLAAFHWPGNVRQLQNEVERLAVLVRGDTVLPDDLSDYLRHGEPAGPGGELNLARARAALERRLIREALAKTAGNRTAAARMLGISREALRQKMRKLGMNAAR